MEETFGVLTISPYSIIHMIAFPENYKKYIEGAFVSDLPVEELRKWERSYDYAVRKLTYIKKGKQLILKSPDNTARIRELWGMYPDARFINIHRDPYKTVRSTIHMFRTEMDSLRLTEEPDNIDELIEKADLSDAAAEKAAQLLAETGSAQRSDCVLDRACFAQLEKLAADSRCGYLQRYVRAMIDAANLRSLVRTERLHMDPGFLQEVLFEGGSVPVDTLRAGVGNGVAALFRSTALREAAEEGEAAVKGGSLTAFEKACDNAVLKTAAGARQVPFGVEVALGYLIAKEAEWTAVRIVMAGRLAGLSADAIRERLRDAYV